MRLKDCLAKIIKKLVDLGYNKLDAYSDDYTGVQNVLVYFGRAFKS